MRLTIHSFCAYFSGPYGRKERRHLDAARFIQALRGGRIRGAAQIPVLGRGVRVPRERPSKALQYFGAMAAHYLGGEFPARAVALIPVPNSWASQTSARKPRTTMIAAAIAVQGGAHFRVHDVLRWKEPVIPVRKGGPQSALVLIENLALVGDVPKRAAAVLVDDVVASTGHVRACYAFLAHHGIPLARAVCAAREVARPVRDPFAAVDEIV